MASPRHGGQGVFFDNHQSDAQEAPLEVGVQDQIPQLPRIFMAIEPQVPMDKVGASAPRLFSFGSWICKNGRVGKIVKRRVGEPVRESGQMVNALAS
jgi:hypothetical protein